MKIEQWIKCFFDGLWWVRERPTLKRKKKIEWQMSTAFTSSCEVNTWGIMGDLKHHGRSEALWERWSIMGELKHHGREGLVIWRFQRLDGRDQFQAPGQRSSLTSPRWLPKSLSEMAWPLASLHKLLIRLQGADKSRKGSRHPVSL